MSQCSPDAFLQYIYIDEAQWRSSAPKSGGGAQTSFKKSEKQKKRSQRRKSTR